jgi:quercetin dioxygenase-like cupin family protein
MTVPLVSAAGEGEVFEMEPGSLVRFKIFSRDVDGLLEMYERELPPHTIGADPHVHHTTTETFYVVSGNPTILCGSTRRRYAPGSIVVVTPHTVHAYDNETDEPVTVLICFTPGLGHEEFFRELSALKAGPAELYQERLDALRVRFDSTSVTVDPDVPWETDAASPQPSMSE